MNSFVLPYETPRLTMVGDFTELTRIVGGWMYIDNVWGAGWWNG